MLARNARIPDLIDTGMPKFVYLFGVSVPLKVAVSGMRPLFEHTGAPNYLEMRYTGNINCMVGVHIMIPRVNCTAT